MKPMIGVVPLMDEKKNSYWMLPGYMDGVAAAGGIPVILPLHTGEETIGQITDSFAGFLFTGGHDIAPALYGETPLPECGPCSQARDALETALFRAALAADKPVFGICRGIQLMNTALGGTLYQDLPTQRPSPTRHLMERPYDRAVHTVTIAEDTPLFSILGCRSLEVNSLHHQAVKDLAPGLAAAAVSEDGLVEGVWLPGKRFVLAVQWHPEYSYATDEHSAALFAAFIHAAK